MDLDRAWSAVAAVVVIGACASPLPAAATQPAATFTQPDDATLATPPQPPSETAGSAPSSAPASASATPSADADLPKARDRRGVTKRADGACFEFAPFHCPSGQTCKPPQPHRVRCPD